MGAALIKAKARVSSAVISRPGATANQWTASAAIIINGSRSEKLEGNKKEWERLYQEAPTTCAEQEKAGEMETNRPREQDRQHDPNAAGFIFLFAAGNFVVTTKGNLIYLCKPWWQCAAFSYTTHFNYSQVSQWHNLFRQFLTNYLGKSDFYIWPCQNWRFGPCVQDQSSAAGVNWAFCPVSQACAGSGSYTNTSTSALCFHGISIPNVFQDQRECNYFGRVTRSLRKLWLNKWILTRRICIQKHSGFGGSSGWCAGEGLRRSVWISSFILCSL